MSLRTIIAAGLTATVVTAGLAAPATAQTENSYDIFLGVGADPTSANLSWYMPSNQQQQVQVKDGSGKVVTVDGTNTKLTLTKAQYSTFATLTGLTPGESYRYRIGSEEAGWTEWFDLKTQPTSDTWNFLFYGDPQVDSSDVTKDTEGWQKTLSTSLGEHPNTAFVASAGDQVENPTDELYEAFLSPSQLRNYRLGVLNGNHDNRSRLDFARHYNLPNAQDLNYYYEYNNALIVALDTNTIDYNELANFTRTAIAQAGAGKDWIIVTFHHPPFAHSWHAWELKPKNIADNLGPVFSDLGVDLVLNGHEHVHTRSHLMSGTTPRPTDGKDLHPRSHEVLYYTANSSSGSKFYDFAASGTQRFPGITYEESVAKNLVRPEVAYWNQDYTPDYTNVEVSPEKLTLTAYNVDDGSVVDTVTLNKQRLAPLPDNPSTHTSLPGDEEITAPSTPQTETETATATVTVIPEPSNEPEPEASTSSDLQVAGVVMPILAVLAALGTALWTQRDAIMALITR